MKIVTISIFGTTDQVHYTTSPDYRRTVVGDYPLPGQLYMIEYSKDTFCIAISPYSIEVETNGVIISRSAILFFLKD